MQHFPDCQDRIEGKHSTTFSIPTNQRFRCKGQNKTKVDPRINLKSVSDSAGDADLSQQTSIDSRRTFAASPRGFLAHQLPGPKK
jgi:hypothetical protein